MNGKKDKKNYIRSMFKADKNALFQFLVEKRRINEFDIENYENSLIIVYKDSPMRFKITPTTTSTKTYNVSKTLFNSKFSLADFSLPLNIKQLISFFSGWLDDELRDYIYDLNAVDLWELYKSNQNPSADFSNDINDTGNFSEDEKKLIGFAIKDLRAFILEKFEVSETRQKNLDEKLDYLISATNRLQKRDWRGILLSTFIGIVTNLSIGQDQGKIIWDYFMQLLSGIPKLPN